MQYLLGFKRLGWDVLFLDTLDPAMCFDAQGRRCELEASWNLVYFRRVMEDFDLADCFSLEDGRSGRRLGLDRDRVLERVKAAPFFLNINGFLRDDEILGAASRRVFLDIDPGFLQMWCDLGLHDAFQGHDAFVTVGENIGEPGCLIPTCGRDWIPSPPPVVLDRWPVVSTHADHFTSVAAWRGAFDPVEYQGRKYGLRVHEFRQFVDLPGRVSERFQLALDIHPADEKDRQALLDHGWELLDPFRVAGDPWGYRSFIQRSKAEVMVAKTMYAATRSGWLSDRSVCYLASGKPVLMQDTGLGDRYPTGTGLVTFNTLDEAVDSVNEIGRNYPSHARAARQLAEEYFSSDRVLPKLLSRLGI
jgi:hypothetical protein